MRQILYYGVRVPTTQNNKKVIRYKYLMTFLVRCRSRHSVSKGPPDLSPKFFRFAQNLDTRVRVPTTQNNKKVIRYKYLMTFLVRCRSRHSVSKGPPDLSPKFFRFAQNLDTRVRVPTTQNNKKVIRYKYLMTFLVRWKGLEPPTYWFVAIEKTLKYTILSQI